MNSDLDESVVLMFKKLISLFGEESIIDSIYGINIIENNILNQTISSLKEQFNLSYLIKKYFEAIKIYKKTLSNIDEENKKEKDKNISLNEDNKNNLNKNVLDDKINNDLNKIKNNKKKKPVRSIIKKVINKEKKKLKEKIYNNNKIDSLIYEISKSLQKHKKREMKICKYEKLGKKRIKKNNEVIEILDTEDEKNNNNSKINNNNINKDFNIKENKTNIKKTKNKIDNIELPNGLTRINYSLENKYFYIYKELEKKWKFYNTLNDEGKLNEFFYCSDSNCVAKATILNKKFILINEHSKTYEHHLYVVLKKNEIKRKIK